MGSFTSPDGVEIVFDDWEGDNERLPVVLHHGFAADTATNWVAPGVVDAIRATGRRVVSIDARGHGRSGKPHDAESYQDPTMVVDLTCLLDHLGLDKVDLVGYSMGAFVSLEAATRVERFRSVVLGGVGEGALPDGDGLPFDKEGIANVLVADDATGADPTAAGFRMVAESTGADRFALAAVLRANAHASGDLAKVACPVLVIAGDQDPLAAGVDRLVAALPTSRFIQVPGDHLGAVATPEFIAGILGFLAEVESAA